MKLTIIIIFSLITYKGFAQIREIDTLKIFDKEYFLERKIEFYTGNELTPFNILISNYEQIGNSYIYLGSQNCNTFDTIKFAETPEVNLVCLKSCSGNGKIKLVANSFLDSIKIDLSKRCGEFYIKQGNNKFKINFLMAKLLRTTNDILITIEPQDSFYIQNYAGILSRELKRYSDEVNGILIEQMLFRNDKNQVCCIPFRFLIKFK